MLPNVSERGSAEARLQGQRPRQQALIFCLTTFPFLDGWILLVSMAVSCLSKHSLGFVVTSLRVPGGLLLDPQTDPCLAILIIYLLKRFVKIPQIPSTC